MEQEQILIVMHVYSEKLLEFYKEVLNMISNMLKFSFYNKELIEIKNTE